MEYTTGLLDSADISRVGSALVYSRAGTVRFPQVGDGVTPCGAMIQEFFTRMNGTGKTLEFDDGEYIIDANYPAIDNFYIVAPPSAIFSSMQLDSGVLLIKSNSGIEGGIWENRRCRFSTITEVVVNSSTSFTLTCQNPHAYIPADIGTSVQAYCFVGLNLNGLRTITAINDSTHITISSISPITGAATIPFERADLYNTGSRAIYPFIARQREEDNLSNIFLINGTGGSGAENIHLRDLTARHCKQNFLYMWSGINVDLHNFNGQYSTADGIHIVGASRDVRFTGKTTIDRVEEAGFALIGQRTATTPEFDISIQHLEITNCMHHGGGVDIAGVSRLSIERLIIRNMASTGVRMVYDSTSSYTYGNRDIHIRHATLHTCGTTGVVPAGWDNTPHSAFEIVGASEAMGIEKRASKDITFGVLEIINPRLRALGGAGGAIYRVKIGDLIVHGGGNDTTTSVQLLDWRDCQIDRITIENSNQGAAFISSPFPPPLSGTNKIGRIDVLNCNNGSPVELSDAECDGTTVTYFTKTNHSMTGKPMFRTMNIGSSFASGGAAGALAGQNADHALNQNWVPTWTPNTDYGHGELVVATGAPTPATLVFQVFGSGGTSHLTDEPTWPTAANMFVDDNGISWVSKTLVNKRAYKGIAYPDATTIQLTGTGLAATNNPRMYNLDQNIPQAALYRGASAANDVVSIDPSVPGTNSWEINGLRLVEQFLPVEWLVQDLSVNGALRLFDARDNTGCSLGLTGVVQDGGELGLQSTTRLITGAFVGTPAPKAPGPNLMYGMPCYLARGQLFTRIGFSVDVIETGKSARLGIYNPAGKLIVAAPELVNAFNVTGDYEARIYQYLERGWYWLTFLCNATAVTGGQITFHTVDTPPRARMVDSVQASDSTMDNPDQIRTLIVTYGAIPNSANFARATAVTPPVTEPHLWIQG